MKNKEYTELNDEMEEQQPTRKKAKTFSVKEFRKNLTGNNITDQLRQFHEICLSETKNHDYVLGYLQAGGSCLELLRLMEMHTDVCHLILEISYFILLEINSKYPQYNTSARDACRYFLSTYMTMTNKMLSMNSTRPERIAILKFLTAVVATSPNFAKDILIHININTTNLGFLTNVGYSKDPVRSAFINFLMAFLIDGYYPTILALLDRRGLLTSILKGLINDIADTVCVVISTLKVHILENPLVSKTVKMRTFSTPVVKDIVQLYNWKGPVRSLKKSKKKESDSVPKQIDPQQKLKVSECVHEFLLILCTSNKYGVIFRDPLVGLGRKTQNSLMYTVLESLEMPWKHSYASELVIKICVACPDLTRTVWGNLKQSLEPRRTEQWLQALKFMERLLKEFDPGQLEYCMKELSSNQLAQITQNLVAPTQILKTLSQQETFSDKYLKHHVLKALTHSIGSIESFLKTFRITMPPEQFLVYDNLIKDHIDRNFPNSTEVLANFKAKDDSVNNFSYLDIVFELLSIYQRVHPQLLDFTSQSINFRKILDYTKKNSGENGGVLEMKIAKLYLELDPIVFLPNTELFEQVMPFVLDCYCRMKDETSYKVLERLFLNTGAFESCESEVRIWMSSLSVVNCSSDSIVGFLVNVLKMTFEKSALYFSQLSDFKANLPSVKDSFDINELLEILTGESVTSKGSKPSKIRHVNLSPLLLAMIEYISNVEVDKGLKSYLEYSLINLLHLQTDPSLFACIIEKCGCDFLSGAVLEYLTAWTNPESEKTFPNKKGKFDLYSGFSTTLVAGDITTFLSDHEINYEGDILNLLNMSRFYIANFSRDRRLDQKLLGNSLTFVKYCDAKGMDVDILKHPVFLQYFGPQQVEKEGTTHALLTNFMGEVIKETVQENDVLEQYRNKLFNCLRRMFRKASKYKDIKTNRFMNIVEILSLSTEQSFLLLELVGELHHDDMIGAGNSASIFVSIITFLLNSLNVAGMNYGKMLEIETVQSISRNLTLLIGRNENIDVASYAKSFTIYLRTFPHCLDYVSKDLFLGIISKEDYNREYVELSLLLLKYKLGELHDDLFEHIERISTKKGFILPILDVLVDDGVNEENLRIIFDKIEPILTKALQKPQKAGQHFEKYYNGVNFLMKKFFTYEKCKSYVDKIHKYETVELFHVSMLRTIFEKAISEDEKHIGNSVLICTHLCMNFFKKKVKSDEDWVKFHLIVDVIIKYFDKIPEQSDSSTLYSPILLNETFKTFCKFCLKFGLSGQPNLLSMLTVLAEKLKFTPEEANLLMDMIVSHSQFLDWILDQDSECKIEILKLMRELFKGSKDLMTKQYLPVLLGSYRATLRTSDRIIYDMLKMFEAIPNQTHFYDFNPFLWGKSAANHYSIRSDVQKALWRQPRVGAVLDILEENRVLDTINRYPLDLPLDSTIIDLENVNVYDLTFLIPLFTLLLAPENAVQTYRFTKSGALALTITALCSEDRDTRNGACFVLSRFYHHVEVRQNGKDNQLWLRFVEAVCKGMASMEDLKLNKFASVFLARMSLVLTQPTHIMYVPLSQYLSAKSTLDFSMIPELYTLLHSPDVNFKDHRNFILEVLRDGLVSGNDFHVALRSVSFKLILEQYTSVVTDIETKLLILQVIERATRLGEGNKFLCTNYGLLSWLYNAIIDMNKSYKEHVLICFRIVFNIVSCKENVDLFIIILLIGEVIDDVTSYNLTADALMVFVKILCLIFGSSRDWLTETRLRTVINFVDSKQSAYILKYGGKNVRFGTKGLILTHDDVNYYVKFLTLSWLRKTSEQIG